MHRREINKLAATTAQKGLTLIPLKIYFNNHGQAKVLVGLARGRRDYQKKAEDKRKAVQREMEQW
jgi:SsrA-binding protein